MNKEKELTVQEITEAETGEPEQEDGSMVVELSKPYKLDGKEIREVDLGTLADYYGGSVVTVGDLTGADMLTINRMMRKRGNVDASPEFTLEYAFYAAMQATGLPLEFFHMLSMKDSMKIKTRVNYFLLY